MSLFKILLLTSICISLSVGRIKIYSPQSLKDILGNDGVVESSIANFGHIPYGHMIIGQPVFLPDNQYGCSSYGSTLKNMTESSPIVIVRRGDCSFVQKVRNIEHGGGKLAIVVDEKDDEDAKFITMVDDGTGNGK